MNLTAGSIRRPLAVLVLFGLAMVLGLSVAGSLRMELLPDMSTPVVSVVTTYPGASPQEVEDNLSVPLEDSVSSVGKVKHVGSTSMENVSVLNLEFQQDVNLDLAVQDVQRAINANLDKLPAEAGAPVINKFSLSDLPVVQTSVTAQLDAGALYHLIDKTIIPRLAKIPGVGQVTVSGGTPDEIKVNLDRRKLDLYGIGVLQVQQAIQTANLEIPAGAINDADGRFTVRLSGRLTSEVDLGQVVLTTSAQKGTVRLKDVAEIQRGTVDPDTLSRRNGLESVGLDIRKQTGANSVVIAGHVRQELDRLEGEHRTDKLHFAVTKDDSVFTKDSIREVFRDILLAVLLVGVTMFVFLHSARNTLILMVAIPATLLTTLLAIFAFNFSLNLISTLALTLVVGILVDDSIVVIENTHKHLETGKDKVHAALDGQGEIAFAAVSITLVIVIAFLPLATVGGLIGGITLQFAAVIVVATLVSLVVSFTMTPMLSSRFGKLSHPNPRKVSGRFTTAFDRTFDRIVEAFLVSVRWTLGHKAWALGLAGLAVAASLALVPARQIGSEFITQVDRGELQVTLEFPQRTTLEETNRQVRILEKELFTLPEVESAVVTVGSANTGFSSKTETYLAQVAVTLVPKDRRQSSSADMAKTIETRFRQLPGLQVKALSIGILGNASDPVEYSLAGSDRTQVTAEAARVEALLKAIPGTGQVRTSYSAGKPELRINVDRDKVADLGLNLQTVGATLRMALTGNTDLSLKNGSDDTTIRIILDQGQRRSTADLPDVVFINNQGKSVSLYQFARVEQTLGPDNLTRRDRMASVSFSTQALGRPGGEIGKDIDQAFKAHPLPAGMTFEATGTLANQADSFKALGIAMAVSLLFIYCVLVILFNSWIYPLSVLFSIPVALVGALVGLWLTHNTLNIFSILGLLMLLGLVAKNAILLVDQTLRLMKEGLPVDQALEGAVRSRLRPIFMTTATMILGMLPVALGLGSSGEIKAAVGVVLIGGLLSSLVLTVQVVPAIFQILEKLRGKNRPSSPKATELDKPRG